MKVQVLHGLARAFAAVIHYPEAVLEVKLLCYLRRRLKNLGDCRAVFVGYLRRALYMLLRDNKYMKRSLRLKVIERENTVILINFF